MDSRGESKGIPMNITFLIGNGFDINLGLKTRYTDFYPFYLKKDHEDILSKAILDNYDNWADLELALGQHLHNLVPEQIEAFLDSKGLLEDDLVEYLKNQEKRIGALVVKAYAEFLKRLAGFYMEFSAKERNAFLEWQKRVPSVIRYQFISFNYTRLLDQILDGAKKASFPASHTHSNTKYQDELGEIIHIHGTLSGNLILGINDAGQISNPSLREQANLTEYIVKPIVNESLGEQLMDIAKRTIDDSDYVCVYGMSLGETDVIWWEYLLDWLKNKSTRRLVLYIYEGGQSSSSGQQKMRRINRWKNVFLDRAKASSDIIDKLRAQIIVLTGSKIFDNPYVELLPGETENRVKELV